MPKLLFTQVKLPANQPDCCVECPLLGLIPDYYDRPKNSKETMVCLGTNEALSGRGSKVRASNRDKFHPLRRPCDRQWKAWQRLPNRCLPVAIQAYNECRIPYQRKQQFKIKFHN